ncbi:hypothetical protein QN277_008158 [Acacia crassicarpa]|uniref:Uncharacterized protein n=1 Tax=Acacia crassicarpa TaxID=499986 RepID=A0AAE1IR73_9FABA|nr:hypothetical protein QN277_008158 [Acacia crassicarpa]
MEPREAIEAWMSRYAQHGWHINGFCSLRAEVEVGGSGPVSLTLALKHGDVEALQQHHRQLSRHFGGHVINDFVGQ